MLAHGGSPLALLRIAGYAPKTAVSLTFLSQSPHTPLHGTFLDNRSKHHWRPVGPATVIAESVIVRSLLKGSPDARFRRVMLTIGFCCRRARRDTAPRAAWPQRIMREGGICDRPTKASGSSLCVSD